MQRKPLQKALIKRPLRPPNSSLLLLLLVPVHILLLILHLPLHPKLDKIQRRPVIDSPADARTNYNVRHLCFKSERRRPLQLLGLTLQGDVEAVRLLGGEVVSLGDVHAESLSDLLENI